MSHFPTSPIIHEKYRAVSSLRLSSRSAGASTPRRSDTDAEIVLHGRWVIPIVPKGIVYENYAIVIGSGGRIIEIIPSALAETRHEKAHMVRRTSHALIPGLVNTHGHTPMTLLRGIADDKNLQEWLEKHIFPVERRWVSPEFVRDGSTLAMAEMLKGGTTTFADMYYFGEETAEEVDRVGMRALIGLTVLKFPTAWAKSTAEYMSKSLNLMTRYQANPRIKICFAPHAPYTVEDDMFTAVAQLSAERDQKVMCHIHETATEVQEALKETGMRPIERLRRLGMVNDRLLAVHCTQLTDEEIELFAKQGVSVAHCPESNMKLASGACPVSKLLKAGVTVSLGTDGAASNNDLDMFGEMRTAALLGKLTSGDPTATSATDVLEMATLGGAKALGFDQDVGSLEVGKFADVVAVSLDDLATQPLYSALSHLVYASTRSNVTDVWIGGRDMVRDGRILPYDEEFLLQVAKKWGRAIKEES